jgi:hypothetical protein
MDQTALVSDQIEDGKRLLGRLAEEGIGVTAAAWLKESDGERWHLYLATHLMREDSDPRPAYRRILLLVQQMPHPFGIEPLTVRLVEGDGPLAQAITTWHQRHPGNRVIPYDGVQLGGVSIEGAYIYPEPSASDQKNGQTAEVK